MTDPIRIFTDEDVYGSIARRLHDLGLDAVSTPEVGRRGASDESQLAWATQQGRVVLSCNVKDFARLHGEWCLGSKSHAGIIVSSRRSIGDLLRRIEALAAALTAEQMRGRLEFLSTWCPRES